MVFPEGTLHTAVVTTFDFYLVASEVPTADELIAPCDLEEDRYSNLLVRLSCAARKFSVYLVVNLAEKAVCSGYPECKVGRWNLYNTNVVFDRDGIVIARYRKYNLFGQRKMINKPILPEVVTFRTDFNVTFGLFTCFDILFEQPAVALVREGIQNYVLPTFWFSEYPFLTSIQAQEQWAFEHNVTLLAAGANYPKIGSGGTGIYHGRNGGLLADIIGGGGTKFYSTKVIKDEIYLEGTNHYAYNTFEELDNLRLLQDDLSKYSSVLLESSEMHTTICSANFCCAFDVLSTFNPESAGLKYYQYRLVAYSGVRSFTGMYYGGVEICGVVGCTGKALDSCRSRFENYGEVSWPRTFTHISIRANYTNSPHKSQYPNSLLSNLRPVPARAQVWKSVIYKSEDLVEREHTLVEPQHSLYTFAIFGRDVSRDHAPRLLDN